jgi:hypothetical protein
VQRGNGSGYAQQWNFALQKTFGENWSIETGYLGSKLTRLGMPDVNLNQLQVSDLALGEQLTQQALNPFFGEIPPSSSLGGPTIARQQLLRPYPRFTEVTLYRNNTGHSMTRARFSTPRFSPVLSPVTRLRTATTSNWRRTCPPATSRTSSRAGSSMSCLSVAAARALSRAGAMYRPEDGSWQALLGRSREARLP